MTMSGPAYVARRASRSSIHQVRGIACHVREWGEPGQPKLFLLHGWMDVSASFQFLVDYLAGDWHVLAPDWRGFGLSGRAPAGYWFQDYYADLDAILEHCSPDAPVNLVGHSMGGNVACTYAGIRPQRVRRLASLEGFGSQRTVPAMAPERYERWLAELRVTPGQKRYTSLEAVAERLREGNPRLPADKARFLAPHWARESEAGGFVMRFDPRHRVVNPVLNRVDELMACWRRITCPVLWVRGTESTAPHWREDTPAQLAERKACFRDFRELEFDRCGHMIHHDAPERLAPALEAFIGSDT